MATQYPAFAFSLFERRDTFGTIAFKVLGARKDGVPLLLIAGMSGVGLVDWMPLAESLAETRPVLIFDNRGIGFSHLSGKEGAGDKYELQDMADDAIELVKHVGWKKVNILGYSMGGMIAQTILTTPHLPFKISHCVLAATSTKPPHSELLENMPAPGAAQPLTLSEKITAVTPMIRINYTPAFVADPANASLLSQRILESVSTRRPAKQIARQIDAISRFDVRKKLRSVSFTIPVLIIHGALDKTVYVSERKYIEQGIPHATIAQTPHDEYGHQWLDFFTPEFWTGLLDDFLEDREPRPVNKESPRKAKL